MRTDILISFGLLKLIEDLNKKEINLPDTVEILNDALSKLDLNDEQYIKKMEALKNAIKELNDDHNNFEKQKFMNKMFSIQQIFDLNSLR